jgi:hypothetical protein
MACMTSASEFGFMTIGWSIRSEVLLDCLVIPRKNTKDICVENRMEIIFKEFAFPSNCNLCMPEHKDFGQLSRALSINKLQRNSFTGKTDNKIR